MYDNSGSSFYEQTVHSLLDMAMAESVVSENFASKLLRIWMAFCQNVNKLKVFAATTRKTQLRKTYIEMDILDIQNNDSFLNDPLSIESHLNMFLGNVRPVMPV